MGVVSEPRIQTQGKVTTLKIPPAEFLDGEKDLCVGLLGASRNPPDRPLLVKEFKVTVWTKSP